jgi:hypothetical protein
METGGVQDVETLYKVLELSHMNNTKEQESPLTPQGVEEGKPEIERPQKTKHDTEAKAETPKSHPESELFEAIRGTYNAVLPELPKAEKVTSSRAKTLRQRIREDLDRQEPEWWRKFFSDVRGFPWPMGRNKDNWCADFDWLIGERGMQKILEGSFQKAPNGNSSNDSLELQKKYTDSEGRIDAKAMLRDAERASARR